MVFDFDPCRIAKRIDFPDIGAEGLNILTQIKHPGDCFISQEGMDITVYKIDRFKLVRKRSGIHNADPVREDVDFVLDILILDEATTGLDPVMRDEMCSMFYLQRRLR